MKDNRSILFMTILTLSAVLSLVACGSGGGTSPASFHVTLINITQSQPLSPMAVVLHSNAYSAWDLGASASHALEVQDSVSLGRLSDTFGMIWSGMSAEFEHHF